MFETILVPTAGDPGADRAVEYAVTEAQLHDADVQLLTVKDTGSDLGEGFSSSEVESKLESQAREVLRSARERIPEEIQVDSFVKEGTPKETILDHVAEYDVDLIVMATHGRTGIQRYLIGSTTESVVRHSDVPVLTVRSAES